MHISTPVRHGHGSPDAGVPLLDEVDWCLVHVLDLALQHGVPDEAGARAHDLGDAARAQHVGGHHAGQVTHHAAAHRPRHLAQADVALNTILSVSLAVLYFSEQSLATVLHLGIWVTTLIGIYWLQSRP